VGYRCLATAPPLPLPRVHTCAHTCIAQAATNEVVVGYRCLATAPTLPLPSVHTCAHTCIAQAATNEVVVGYQEHTARLERHKADAALERSVLKMFYLDPQKLEVRVQECGRGCVDAGVGVGGCRRGKESEAAHVCVCSKVRLLDRPSPLSACLCACSKVRPLCACVFVL